MNEKEEALKKDFDFLWSQFESIYGHIRSPANKFAWKAYLELNNKRQAEIDSLIGELGHAVPDGTPESKHENVICKYIIKEKDAEIDKLKNEIQLMKNEFNDVYLPRHTLETDKLKELVVDAIEYIGIDLQDARNYHYIWLEKARAALERIAKN